MHDPTTQKTDSAGDGAPPPRSGISPLARMGSGGHGDRLGFKLVVGLLWRCVRLLKPVRKHLVALTIPSLALYVLSFVASGLTFDIFWTRALLGQPLTAEEASILGLDPLVTVHVEKLSEPIRRELIQQLSWIGIAMGALYLPVGLGLYYYFMWILQRVNQLLRVELLERLQSLFHFGIKRMALGGIWRGLKGGRERRLGGAAKHAVQ